MHSVDPPAPVENGADSGTYRTTIRHVRMESHAAAPNFGRGALCCIQIAVENNYRRFLSRVCESALTAYAVGAARQHHDFSREISRHIRYAFPNCHEPSLRTVPWPFSHTALRVRLPPRATGR